MAEYATNQDRTAAYLEKFDRQAVLSRLLGAQDEGGGIRGGPVVLDIGSNDGATVREFKTWWPTAVIHCFEPQSECWEALDAVAQRYGQGDVVINRSAAGNESLGSRPFFTHEISTGLSGFHRISETSRDSIDLTRAKKGFKLDEYLAALNRPRSVPVVRPDEYLRDNNIDTVDLVKIDTQGHEPEVLEGFGNLLSECGVVLVELMFYDYYEKRVSFSDVERFLNPAGLSLYDISHISKNPMNGRTDWVDVIYVHERLRQ